MSKDSLVKGTLILAVAALVARVLGVVQRVPLVYLIGDGGMATFSIAFNIYTPLLTIATAGIPSALSKMVSERTELGRHAEADRIFRAAVQFALVAGVIMTILLFLIAPSYARMSGDESAALAIRALAPALLLFPLIAMLRGYFQGRQKMMPNGLSQIIEQIMRLITAVGLAYLLLAIGWGHDWAVAGASFGGVMGSIGAFAVLLLFYNLLKQKDAAQGLRRNYRRGQPLPYRTIYGQIFRLSVPIVLFSMAVPLVYFIDTSTVIPLLQNLIGTEQAKVELGVLTGRAQSLAGIPIILAVALSQSIVPIVSAAYARNDLEQVKQQGVKAMQISVLTGLPVVLAIAVAARPINGTLFPDENGTMIIAMLTATALFQIMMQTSGAILMGIGAMRPLIVNVFAGLAVKLAGSFALAPWLGISGVVLSTALCFIVMMLLNFRTMRSKVPFVILGLSRWMKLAAATAIIVAAGTCVERFMYRYVTWFPNKVDYFLNAAVTGLVVIALYPLLLMAFRVVTKHDLANLPGPLQKLVRKVSAAVNR
ncbi:polysaccharide biosynthesis protein [Paenibacillus sp. J2TS4]|uniref:putative polysaccharide biosynthesis protein n=1 Tax=Paenibacillus sp. J2TS4 TaxID=2807194 RepID=UPI001B1048E7|nr:polysaccharide biosynthesis protein [Paenibacillus sp. J2TS4]GIP31162.1 stage V sporulation protein B [Paenibacillus sp. J2TS4]